MPMRPSLFSSSIGKGDAVDDTEGPLPADVAVTALGVGVIQFIEVVVNGRTVETWICCDEDAQFLADVL